MTNRGDKIMKLPAHDDPVAVCHPDVDARAPWGLAPAICKTVWAALLCSALFSSALAAPAVVWQPRPETYGDLTVPNVSVVMDDGVTLVGDVMYPTDLTTGQKAAGTFPVLLTQNPYTCQTTQGNTGPLAALGPGTTGTSYFVRRGYILASICVRGTGRSGGNWEFFGLREQQDGVALVDWAANRLDGSNGVLGLTGCSYLGATQIFTAGALRPGSPVKAMLPSCWGAETYREPVFSGGMPTQSINYFRSVTDVMGPQPALFGQALAQEIALGGERAYRHDWFKLRDAGQHAQRIVDNGIPVLLWSGWNDLFAQGAMEMYAQLQNAYAKRATDAPMKRNNRATGRYQIVVGPWAHAVGIDPAIALRWFDTWLRAEPTGMADTAAPMHLYQLGSADWINTDRYPMVDKYTRYYLQPGGALSPTAPSGLGGSDLIAYTQPSLPYGTLSYQTPPFAQGATIAGPISAKLYASTGGTNLNLIATLYDVAPDSTSTRLTTGSIVGSSRQLEAGRSWFDDSGINIRPYGNYLSDSYLVPGTNYELSFRILARVAQLAPGHALRLTLTTQTPEADCVNVLGTDPCYPTAPQALSLPGFYQVQRALSMPSAVNLPLLPYACFPADGGNGAQPMDLGSPKRPASCVQ